MQKGYIMLAEILSSKIRSEVFRLLFDQDDKALHLREIERRSGFTIGTVQRELKKLSKLDLIIKRIDGNRSYYEANKLHPLYKDICKIVEKTIGVNKILSKALKQSKNIEFAFIFGSIASKKEKSHSDIDLFVIGELGLRKITSLLSGITEKTGRDINPHIFSKDEFIQRITNNDHFITNIMQNDKIFLIGEENEFRKLVE